jgi:hypothetical protein
MKTVRDIIREAYDLGVFSESTSVFKQEYTLADLEDKIYYLLKSDYVAYDKFRELAKQTAKDYADLYYQIKGYVEQINFPLNYPLLSRLHNKFNALKNKDVNSLSKVIVLSSNDEFGFLDKAYISKDEKVVTLFPHEFEDFNIDKYDDTDSVYMSAPLYYLLTFNSLIEISQAKGAV